MQRTLIAVFDNRGDAQSAIEELVSAGYSRQQIRLSEGDPTGGANAITGDKTADTHTGTGLVDSIRTFLGTMFGTDNSEHVQKYSDAVTRGHHVLTLTAADEHDIERAADIVERFGPVDIDAKAAQWSGGALASEAMRMGAGAQQQSASLSQQSVQGTTTTQGGQGTAGTMQGGLNSAGTVPGSQGSAGTVPGGQSPAGTMQSGQGASGTVSGSQGGAGTMQGGPGGGSQQLAPDATAGGPGTPSPFPMQRSGVKVFEHFAEPALDETDAAIKADEEYYRGHYASTYAGAGDQYDDYAPAYQYGADRASDEQYRGRPWKDVEPALRSDWEGRHPGSAWDKFKAAVRHGWEKITS